MCPLFSSPLTRSMMTFPGTVGLGEWQSDDLGSTRTSASYRVFVSSAPVYSFHAHDFCVTCFGLVQEEGFHTPFDGFS